MTKINKEFLKLKHLVGCSAKRQDDKQSAKLKKDIQVVMDGYKRSAGLLKLTRK